MKISRWILLGTIGFLLSVAVSILFIYYSQQLLGSDRSIFYFIILFPLGISSAVFLFKVLESFAEFSGHKWAGTLRLGGPVVVFCLVFIGGYYFYQNPPLQEEFNLKALFRDVDHPSRNLNGKVKVTDETGRNDNLEVKDGEAIVQKVKPKTTLSFSVDVPGYTLRTMGIYKAPIPGKSLQIDLVEDTLQLNKIKRLQAKISKYFRVYLSNAIDLKRIICDTAFYLNNDALAIQNLNSTILRYSDSYDSLNSIMDSAKVVNYSLMAFNRQELNSLFRCFDNIHNSMFLRFDHDIIPTLEKNTPKIIRSKKADLISMVNNEVLATEPDFDYLRTNMPLFMEKLNF